MAYERSPAFLVNNGYGTVVATRMEYAEAVARVKDLLEAEGFGVLCEIDVTKTLRDKLSMPFRPYVIIGACNPQLAHRALTVEAQIGLLLPCNLVVQEHEGRTLVSAIDAEAMLGNVGSPALEPVAADANERLTRVLSAIANA